MNKIHQELWQFLVDSQSNLTLQDLLYKGFELWFLSEEHAFTPLADGPPGEEWGLRAADPELISTVDDIHTYNSLFFGTATREDGLRYWLQLGNKRGKFCSGSMAHAIDTFFNLRKVRS